jgi:hypothetical protein
VDELQVSYGAFVDDFDDGVFPDGGEGEPMLYTVPCGVVTDADESGGLLSPASSPRRATSRLPAPSWGRCLLSTMPMG